MTELSSNAEEQQNTLQRHKQFLTKHDAEISEIREMLISVKTSLPDNNISIETNRSSLTTDIMPLIIRLQSSHAELGQTLASMGEGQSRLHTVQQELANDVAKERQNVLNTLNLKLNKIDELEVSALTLSILMNKYATYLHV